MKEWREFKTSDKTSKLSPKEDLMHINLAVWHIKKISSLDD